MDFAPDVKLVELFEQFQSNLIDENEFERRKEVLLGREDTIPDIPLDSATKNNLPLELQQLVSGLFSNDLNKQLQGLDMFRDVLEADEHMLRKQQLIEAKVVPRLVQFLASDTPQLQYEAILALSSFTAEEHVPTLMDSNAVPSLVQCLNLSLFDEIKEQAVITLGNIVARSTALRDKALASDVIPLLLQNMTETSTPTMVLNCLLTLSHVCNGNPKPQWEALSVALPTLASLITSTESKVLADTCWTLSHLLADGTDDQIQKVIDSGVCLPLASLIMHQFIAVQKAALRAVGNIFTGNAAQSKYMLGLGVLPSLHALLQSPMATASTRREVCWILANITSGHSEQVQALIDENIYTTLIQLLNSDNYDLKREVVWVLSNTASVATLDQLRYLISHAVVPRLCPMLELLTDEDLAATLNCLEKFLGTGPTTKNEVAESMLDECNGFKMLDALTRPPVNENSGKASQLIQTYFSHVPIQRLS